METVEVVVNEPGRGNLVRFETDKMNPSLKVAWRMLKTRAFNWVRKTYNVKEMDAWQVLNSFTDVHWKYHHHDDQVVGSGFIPGHGLWTFTLREKKQLKESEV